MASHPYLFMTASVFVILLLIAIAFFWGRRTEDSNLNQCIIQSITQLISVIFIGFFLWQYGWLQTAGFTRFGRKRTWMIALIILMYMAAVFVFSRMGTLCFKTRDPRLILWLSVNGFTAGFFEETVFRGILLFTLLWIWRRSKYQMAKSISSTSLLFGCASILKTNGDSIAQTVLGALTATTAGFIYGVLLLHGKSIWIPVVLHGLHKAGVNAFMTSRSAEATFRPDLFLLLTAIPVLLLGIYLLKSIPLNFRFHQT